MDLGGTLGLWVFKISLRSFSELRKILKIFLGLEAWGGNPETMMDLGEPWGLGSLEISLLSSRCLVIILLRHLLLLYFFGQSPETLIYKLRV